MMKQRAGKLWRPHEQPDAHAARGRRLTSPGASDRRPVVHEDGSYGCVTDRCVTDVP
jgi:hypothetical protein